MAYKPQRAQWRRIYLQTLALIHKNLLIFYKAPISLICRALIFPVAVAVIFSVLRNLNLTSSGYDGTNDGIATSSTPIHTLSEAINAAGSSKLVFINNGISNDTISPIVEGVLRQPGLEKVTAHYTNNVNDLYDVCQQSTKGISDCFAAVIFETSNSTTLEYAIALDGEFSGYSSTSFRKPQDTLLAKRVLPLQWAIDAQIGNFSSVAPPQMQPMSGYFKPGGYNTPDTTDAVGPYWLGIVSLFVAPVFILILIGIVYHLATYVATERESSISELMSAQNVTPTPRILSTLASFFVVYFPGLLASSIILTQVLFLKTSDILFLFMTLLAGASMITCSHFLASFFAKAQLAGLYSSTLVFSLSLVTLAASLSSKDSTPQVTALALLFPPCCWATFISDVALREFALRGFSLNPGSYRLVPGDEYSPRIQFLNGYLYLIFFIVQIIVYGAGAYLLERKLWGVTRKFDKLNADSDIALRCTDLSKTYYAKRRWYWPFSKKGKTVQAVDRLNLEVKKGSVTFLLGPNGGGKTTTLKCVAGMTAMDPGSQLDINEAGTIFGICPQSNVFWNDLTVAEHIKIWRRLKTAAFDDQLKDDDDILTECDLMEKAHARAKTLSGGQMRKLQLAISFVGGSKVCCIDEASSGLDPLSRRNIWDIIQKGHSRRTILVTTHFLDEADVLADHVAIVYKGKLVCEGPGTTLKARYGDDYIIRSESDENGDNMVWRTTNSAEATRKILELESLSEDRTYNVAFPTLEQVFLKVTTDTAVHDQGGDGIVGEEETLTAVDEKIFALENEQAQDIDLDVGQAIGLARQISALFHKRYMLLRSKAGWISYGINLIIPIIIASALVKFLYRFHDFHSCSENDFILRTAFADPLEGYHPSSIYIYYDSPPAVVGPESQFNSAAQLELFKNIVGPFIVNNTYDRETGDYVMANNTNAIPPRFVDNVNEMISQLTNYSGSTHIGIFAPTPGSATLFYDTSSYRADPIMAGFSFLTNRLANVSTTNGINRVTSTNLRTMRHAESTVDFRALPIAVLIALSFIAAASISVIYPSFEKNNRVRALQYCNGVSPFALWFAYLLFDMQFILIQSLFVWGLIFAGPLARVWYASTYLLGVFILFGIATYLGTYLLSLFTKKAAFAIAAGVHVLLFILYLVAYIMNQSFGNGANLHQTYSYIQYGLGLTSPGANLGRALFLASNSFEILCGKYAVADTTDPFAYVRYGSVYANLLIQIIFLITVLGIYEYGSSDWWRRNVTHRGVPARLHYIVEADGAGGAAPAQTEKTEKTSRPEGIQSEEILNVSRITKYFGSLFAVENVSFNINTNQTLALLGGNGAGKTTVINMIRGELKPNFGSIHLDGISVLAQPHKAKLLMGVCPQDDAIDNLSVRQTLTFYATVKGLRNVQGNVDKVLTALNITSFASVSVKDLSGGTRRKLSVAIALLGNPRILLLDEPSTGQDAGAKRILWKALQSISSQRAILLTTHSMEEAEALATNVAIMGTRMLAKGSLGELQTRYGGAYSVRAVRVPGTVGEEVERHIKECFEGKVANYFDSHGQVSFNLPHEKRELGAIMRTMEGLKGRAVVEDENEGAAGGAGGSSGPQREVAKALITDYTITGPTLEEVFMNVAREAGQVGGPEV